MTEKHSVRNMILLAALALASAASAQSPATKVSVMAGGLNHPWSLAFLPDGGVLVTERAGGVKLLRNGQIRAVKGAPKVLATGQGGMFDIALHPGFASNGLVYLSYAGGSFGANGTHVARARLVGDELRELVVIWKAAPMKRGGVHFGGRLAFLPDGTLAVTTGDGFDLREQAQKLDSPLGKVMRITDSGGIPADNPFAQQPGANRAVWSYGHRNPQGLAWDPVREQLFSHEHGPRGGDEVNIIVRGGNFGWPVATMGRDYSGATISPFKTYPGMLDALLGWTPSIAPSGLAVYRGPMFPEWEGDLLVGALVDKEVRRVDLDAAGKVLGQQSLFKELKARIRDVRVAPDGAVWLTTDSDQGQVLRVSRQ